jgi:hypothetical protein
MLQLGKMCLHGGGGDYVRLIKGGNSCCMHFNDAQEHTESQPEACYGIFSAIE